MSSDVMQSAEGAAMRVQLDSMLGALAPWRDAAVQSGDPDVLAMVRFLHEARQAALRIEARPNAATGVNLDKALTR